MRTSNQQELVQFQNEQQTSSQQIEYLQISRFNVAKPNSSIVTLESHEKQQQFVDNNQPRELALDQKPYAVSSLPPTTEKEKEKHIWQKKKLTTQVLDNEDEKPTEEFKDPFESHKDNNHDKNHQEHYNPLQIPCDWEIARNHALARRTAPGQDNASISPLISTIQQFKPVLAAGSLCRKTFSLTAAILTISSSQAPGSPCSLTSSSTASQFSDSNSLSKESTTLLPISWEITASNLFHSHFYRQTLPGKSIETNCPNSFFLYSSIANKLDKPDQVAIMQKLNLFAMICNVIILECFRRSSRFINIEIDEIQLTPADYTITVKNIPAGLKLDYKKNLKNIFENYAVQDSSFPIVVEKVVLVYNISDIIEMEEDLKDLVEKKKKQAIKYEQVILKYILSFDYQNPVVKLIDKEIEAIRHVIHFIEEDTMKNPKKFVGMAFVSFQNEQMKNKILEENSHSIFERIFSVFTKGQTPNLNEDHLSWNGQKLFLEEAPEPNAIDWEFVHIGTIEKVYCRIKVLIKTAIMETSCFIVIYAISIYVVKQVDLAHEQSLEGSINPSTESQITLICYFIAFLIVLFNKFGVGKILHWIVDEEKRSNKTQFQISYAKKYSFCLFMNAAIISYIIDIVIQKNIIGYGGFIYNESLVFYLNAILPPFIWVADPWSIWKNYKRNKELEKKEKCVLTQEEVEISINQIFRLIFQWKIQTTYLLSVIRTLLKLCGLPFSMVQQFHQGCCCRVLD